MSIYYPYRFIGEYEDGQTVIINGFSEQECIETLGNIDTHGDLIFYTGYNGVGYVDGECVL